MLDENLDTGPDEGAANIRVNAALRYRALMESDEERDILDDHVDDFAIPANEGDEAEWV